MCMCVCALTEAKPAWASKGKDLNVRVCSQWSRKALSEKKSRCAKSNCKFMPCIFFESEMKGATATFGWATAGGQGRKIGIQPK